MIAKSKAECQEMGMQLSRASERVGLKINKAKTSVMNVHGEGVLMLGDDRIEIVEKFKFLGSYITPSRDSLTDIKTRIGMAKSAANRLNGIWRSSVLTLGMKIRLAKSLI